MAKTIGNPLSWTAHLLEHGFSHLGSVTDRVGSHDIEAAPEIRTLTTADLQDALRKGFDDFAALRTDVIFTALIYPLMGLCLVLWMIQGNAIQLLFPVLAGFALVGPFAAVGLYEMSRQREAGGRPNWGAAIDIWRSPRFGAVVMLGVLHIVLFGMWVMASDTLYRLTLGPDAAASSGAFLSAVLTTPAGWLMGGLGIAIGFVFAVAVLASSLVSFPLLLDRNVGLPVAVTTSLRVAQANKGVVALWGLLVATLLVIGTIPLLLGLIVALPVLGHATWHLYRKAVV